MEQLKSKISFVKDDVTSLLIHLQEQSNLLLEEVINDNRVLKQEVNNLRNLVVRYETLQKDVDKCVFERRECQKEIKLRFAESKLIEEGLRERNTAIKDMLEIKYSNLKDNLNEKLSEVYDRINKDVDKLSRAINDEADKFSNTIVTMKVDAAREGAKYGVIVSVAVFIIVTLVSFGIKWIEKKVIIQ